MTQKSLQSYLYPADRISNLVSVRSYTGANKQKVDHFLFLLQAGHLFDVVAFSHITQTATLTKSS